MVAYTPPDHVVDEHCGASRHGTYTAHRYDYCTCPGPSRDAFERSVLGQRRVAARKRREARGARVLTIPKQISEAKGTGRFPEVRQVGPLERALWDSEDRACEGTPIDLWFTVGVPSREQLDEAWSYCRACPVLRLCRGAAEESGDDEALRALTTPKQRRDERARRQGVRAA